MHYSNFKRLFLCAIAGSQLSEAASIALTPETLDVFRTFTGWSGQQTFGWQFSSSEIISIESLGLYDFEGDGFQRDHEVGLWEVNSGLLVASVSLSQTSSGILKDGFRYVVLGDAVELMPGRYLLGSLGGGDVDGWPADSRESVLGQGLTYEGTWLSNNDDVFEKPFIRISGATGPFDGSNFQYSVIPEPTTLSAGLLVSMTFLVRRDRRGRTRHEM